MYSAYALLYVRDRYDYSEPMVSVVETSNREDELLNRLYEEYNNYKEEVANDYSDEDKKGDWYQNMIRQIAWDDDRKGFSDTSGYKEVVKYVVRKL